MWTEGNYRRNLMDMHIDDWNDEFLSRLDPEEYVSCLKDAGIQAAMVKARSHTGLNYWPGPNGRMHRGLRGRDFVGEMIRRCHEAGIAVVLYYSQIFDNLAYEEHPEWRLVGPDGLTFREYRGRDCFRNGRYGICCPNQPGYRQYVRQALQDLCQRYHPEGFFLDMTFWPEVCYCDACRQRWRQESGLEIPRTVDWTDPDFRRFAAARSAWLQEFAQASTAAVREIDPDVTVEHQFSMITQPWVWGVTEDQALASDFCSGDYYGGYLQQSFINKYYRNLSATLPFCCHTGRCDPELSYHTTTKTEEQLILHAGTALLHGGAFLLVDAINPDGSIQPDIYRSLMKKVYEATRPFEFCAGGTLKSEVAVWFPSRAKYDPSESGTPLSRISHGTSVYADAPLAMAGLLRDTHIPFDVIGSGQIRNYSGRVIALCHAAALTDQEAEDLEAFVTWGGSLYVSGPVGHPGLAALLGVRTAGQTEESFTYLAPASHPELMEGFSASAPLTWDGRQWRGILLEPSPEVLATCVLPWTVPGTERFAAIHSNPPGRPTNMPAATLRQLGESRLLWVSAPLETSRPFMSRRTVENMIRLLVGRNTLRTNAPRFAEILQWDKNGERFLAVINEQEDSPVIPVRDIRIELPERGLHAELLPDGEKLRCTLSSYGTEMVLPELRLFSVIRIRQDEFS